MKYIIWLSMLVVGFLCGYFWFEDEEMTDQEFVECAMHLRRYVGEQEICPFCDSDLRDRI